jgi:hypothetical protein
MRTPGWVWRLLRCRHTVSIYETGMIETARTIRPTVVRHRWRCERYLHFGSEHR